MKCPNCDNEINENYNFCKFCGFNLNISDDLPADNMYCHNCGKLIQSDSRFCIYCGIKIGPIIPEKTIEDYLDDADSEFKLENYEESIVLYLKALEMEYDNSVAVLGLINSYFKLEDYENAILYMNKYPDCLKNRVILDLKLTCELKLNKYEDALNTINNLFKVKTVNLELLFVKCDILEKLDKKEELLENYDKILDIDNQNDVILFKKSKLLFDLSYYEDAFKVIQEAIKINPLDEYSLLKKSIEEKLATKIDGKTYDDALSYFSEHEYFVAKEIVSDFDDAPSIELKCRCLYRLGEYDNALTAVNELLNKQNYASNLNLKAKIYLAMHDEKNSIKFFKLASQLSKDYLTNLAFAYAAFGNIEASKEIYSKMDCELSTIWLKYYDGDDGIIISRLQNDFFNYPHLCCLKVDLYLKKAINFLQNYQNKDGLKYLKLSKKYLDKLIVFINNYKLNKKFVSSNFIYLGELLNKYFVNKKYNPNISRQLMDILKLIMDYYEVESSMLSNNDELYDYYLNVAKLYLSLGYKDAALTSFKLASNYVNSDGELWLYIANLSDENKLVFYNKALFCFEKDLELKYDDNSKKLKGVSLFYLNRKNEAINLIKNLLPSRYDDVKVKNYINDLNKNYSGGF